MRLMQAPRAPQTKERGDRTERDDKGDQAMAIEGKGNDGLVSNSVAIQDSAYKPAEITNGDAVINAASEQQGMQTSTGRSVLKPLKFNDNLICMHSMHACF